TSEWITIPEKSRSRLLTTLADRFRRRVAALAVALGELVALGIGDDLARLRRAHVEQFIGREAPAAQLVHLPRRDRLDHRAGIGQVVGLRLRSCGPHLRLFARTPLFIR